MQISDVDKEAIICWARNHPEIAQVWLYGSRARGDHRPDSDIDLAIVTVGQTLSKRQECWMFAEWRNGPNLTQKVHMEWYDPDAEMINVGPGVKRDGTLLYPRS